MSVIICESCHKEAAEYVGGDFHFESRDFIGDAYVCRNCGHRMVVERPVEINPDLNGDEYPHSYDGDYETWLAENS